MFGRDRANKDKNNGRTYFHPAFSVCVFLNPMSVFLYIAIPIEVS